MAITTELFAYSCIFISISKLMHIHTCLHTYTYLYLYLFAYSRIFIPIYILMHIHTYLHLCIFIPICILTHCHTHLHTYVFICIRILVHIHTYLHTHAYSYLALVELEHSAPEDREAAQLLVFTQPWHADRCAVNDECGDVTRPRAKFYRKDTANNNKNPSIVAVIIKWK